jgi:Bacteriocin-protection, YdeI or OmpD-Associated
LTDAPEPEAASCATPGQWRAWLADHHADAREQRVMSAKREETRDRRLAQLVEASAAGRRIGPLARAS